jgi:hypothetical protein
MRPFKTFVLLRFSILVDITIEVKSSGAIIPLQGHGCGKKQCQPQDQAQRGGYPYGRKISPESF